MGGRTKGEQEEKDGMGVGRDKRGQREKEQGWGRQGGMVCGGACREGE